METIKRSFQEIAAFDREARGYLARREQKWRQENPENKGQPPSTKFTWAVYRMLKRSHSVLSSFNEAVEDLNIKHCSEDKDGNIETDQRGGFKFKRDELLKRNEAQRNLFNSKVEIEPYFATEVPDDLTLEDRDIFSGFVIKETEPVEGNGTEESPAIRRSKAKVP